MVHTKENKEVKKSFLPKRNFCFKKRILTNGEISQEMTNQDTKGDFQKASKNEEKKNEPREVKKKEIKIKAERDEEKVNGDQETREG